MARFSEIPGKALRELLIAKGNDVLRDPQQFKGQMYDRCPENRMEVNLLVAAMQQGVPQALLHRPAGMPVDVLLAKQVGRLEDELALNSEAARWAVDTYAEALELRRPPQTPAHARAQVDPVPPPPLPSGSGNAPVVITDAQLNYLFRERRRVEFNWGRFGGALVGTLVVFQLARGFFPAQVNGIWEIAEDYALVFWPVVIGFYVLVSLEISQRRF